MTTAPLAGLTTAISISESSDLRELGLDDLHQRHAFIEIARHVLAAGGSLAYGGDLRVGGYTASLFDLARTYDLPDKPPADRIIDYLAWPQYLQISVPQQAELRDVARLVPVPPPPDIRPDDPDLASRPGSLPARVKHSRCLTAMREAMAANSNARVILGGKVTGYTGAYPGLVEEAALAAKAGSALYVLGGFGGCAGVVASAVKGLRPPELTAEYQVAADPGYAELVEDGAALGLKVDYDDVVQSLRQAGEAGLRNGLSAEDNATLFETADVDEMVSLVLSGLRAVAARSPHP